MPRPQLCLSLGALLCLSLGAVLRRTLGHNQASPQRWRQWARLGVIVITALSVGDQVRVRKLDYVSRQVVYAWTGTVVATSPECVVIQARFATSLPQPPTVDGVPLLPGDIFTEYYYLDRWYNIFHIADPAGQLKGWYCNIAEPATLDDAGIAFVDFCLDLFVHPDGAMTVLDEDEFAVASASAHCADDPIVARAALDTLMQLARAGALPTDVGRPAILGG